MCRRIELVRSQPRPHARPPAKSRASSDRQPRVRSGKLDTAVAARNSSPCAVHAACLCAGPAAVAVPLPDRAPGIAAFNDCLRLLGPERAAYCIPVRHCFASSESIERKQERILY